MSKMSKALKSTSKQMKLDNLLNASKASKSRSATALDDNVANDSPPSKKRSTFSEAESASESDSGVMHSLFAKAGKSKEQTSTDSSIGLLEEIRKKRVSLYESVAAFRFNKKRVRVISEATQIPENSKGIVYWMSRDQRVQGIINLTL